MSKFQRTAPERRVKDLAGIPPQFVRRLIDGYERREKSIGGRRERS
jgi:hypothetical protein